MWFFKKKKNDIDKPEVIKPPKMDLSKYKYNINIKSICYYEKIAGKSFTDFSLEDITQFIYACFIILDTDGNLLVRNQFISCSQNFWGNVFQQLQLLSGIFQKCTDGGCPGDSHHGTAGDSGRHGIFIDSGIYFYGNASEGSFQYSACLGSAQGNTYRLCASQGRNYIFAQQLQHLFFGHKITSCQFSL
jgi:hypothetical protein